MSLETMAQDVEHAFAAGVDRVREVLASHAPEVEKAIGVVQQVDGDALTQAAMAAAGIPPGAREAFAEFLARVDAEFGKLAAQVPQPAAPEPEPAGPPAEPLPNPA